MKMMTSVSPYKLKTVLPPLTVRLSVMYFLYDFIINIK